MIIAILTHPIKNPNADMKYGGLYIQICQTSRFNEWSVEDKY